MRSVPQTHTGEHKPRDQKKSPMWQLFSWFYENYVANNQRSINENTWLREALPIYSNWLILHYLLLFVVQERHVPPWNKEQNDRQEVSRTAGRCRRQRFVTTHFYQNSVTDDCHVMSASNRFASREVYALMCVIPPYTPEESYANESRPALYGANRHTTASSRATDFTLCRGPPWNAVPVCTISSTIWIHISLLFVWNSVDLPPLSGWLHEMHRSFFHTVAG